MFEDMKSGTVDLVVTGDEASVVVGTLDAVRRGQRVLVVLRSRERRAATRVRRLCRAAKGRVTVMAGAEIACVDGVNGVEAVVIRSLRTGRLFGVNASAFLSSSANRR